MAPGVQGNKFKKPCQVPLGKCLRSPCHVLVLHGRQHRNALSGSCSIEVRTKNFRMEKVHGGGHFN